ncbi:dihydrofolate synthase / folylpolyglutamate synthase [Syntrophus gentianae]|uniref:Dihydrofolate synthase/folylpolyglutamate synthase n=1 Tax=Syntrophus gentianae TaxID=43775 RepID=A0A1H7USQ9_9BACT|nr:folylpolyglutamate synthase/dihydrofolate synthase family protein [Syntrophus gentianae]SEL99477.1 dihydrofolate synthase / folylpolyglutamate synthase [Syntrophus gentianae]
MGNKNGLSIISDLNCNVVHLGLGPIKRLLERIGNPHLAYPAVLIGGTNGKGSVAAILSSILKHSGLKVGVYTSPHLMDIRERIRINDFLIPEDRMQECIETVCNRLEEDLTYFEILTAVAYRYFHEEKVDIAVLEVGMGGRLDATNVVIPQVSVITNVHHDHQEYLGRFLKNIAGEKAGIIKEKSICVTAANQKSVLDILADTCRKKGVPLFRLGKEIRVRSKGAGNFSYTGIDRKISHLTCPLSGEHQIKNAALALAAAELIRIKGRRIDEQAMCLGLAGAKWEGRLEILQKSPTVLVDGAHNPAGIRSLCDTLRNRSEKEGRLLVFGVLGDKDYSRMLKKLLPLFRWVIFTRPKVERAVDLDKLIPIARNHGHLAEAIEDSREALQRALLLAEKNDLICVAGSLYLVGEIKKIYRETSQVKQSDPLTAVAC